MFWAEQNQFSLFQVKDDPNATETFITKGMVEFNNVSFYYDPRYDLYIVW